MNRDILIGISGALITGIAIGVQATFSGRVGSAIGDVQTGILTNLVGGLAAGLILTAILAARGTGKLQLSQRDVVMLVSSGILGILIITGISFSLQRAGVAAGLATVILGQLMISAVVDTLGLGGAEPIPLSLARISGLVLMGASVFLLVPKS